MLLINDLSLAQSDSLTAKEYEYLYSKSIVPITKQQAEWCLENNDKLKIYIESNERKDIIITKAIATIDSCRTLNLIFKEIHKNDSIKSNLKDTHINLINEENKILKKDNTEIKKENKKLKVGVVLIIIAHFLISL